MSEELKDLVASNLLELRKKTGKTQREVAAETGMTAAALSAYEKGIKQPQLDYAVRLARYYGVTLDKLCGLEETSGDAAMTGGEYLYYLTKLCETEHIEVKISESFVPWNEYPGEIDEGDAIMYADEQDRNGEPPQLGYVTLQIYSSMAAHFVSPYKKYLDLYRAGEIDEELFSLWKEKRFEQARGNV